MAYAHGGRQSLRTVTPREIAYGGADLELLAAGITIDAAAIDGGNTGYTGELRAGWPMGMITSTKKWRPCPRTTTTSSGAVTALVVVNSYAFKVGDVISIGSDTGKTVSAIDYTTHTLTISSTTVASGEAVVVEDGSEVCRGFLAGYRDLLNRDTLTKEEREANLVIGGMLNLDMLLGDMTAIWADATSKAILEQRLQIYSPTLGRPLS